MVAQADDEPPLAPSVPVGAGYYNLEDEERLKLAKRTHRETTLSSERAARVRPPGSPQLAVPVS